MGSVIGIHQKKFFSLDGALELLPVVTHITKFAHDQLLVMSTQLKYVSSKEKRLEVEKKAQRIFQKWQDKIKNLGCNPKGMWLVDFDNGEGFYCWHFPEESILYFHGYREGFRGRTKIH